MPGERLRVRLQLRTHARRSDPITLTPAVLDAATFADGRTIDLRADPAALQAALQKLAGR